MCRKIKLGIKNNRRTSLSTARTTSSTRKYNSPEQYSSKRTTPAIKPPRFPEFNSFPRSGRHEKEPWPSEPKKQPNAQIDRLQQANSKKSNAVYQLASLRKKDARVACFQRPTNHQECKGQLKLFQIYLQLLVIQTLVQFIFTWTSY